MHKMCRYILYTEPSFKQSFICIWTALSVRAETLAIIKWSKEAKIGLRYAHVVHAIPFSAISQGNFCWACLRSSKSGSDRNDPKGQDKPCGQCQHRVRARIPRVFECWWPPSSVRWFSVSSLTSLRASMVCALATHQIWTNGYCAHHRLRAYVRWLHTCIPQVTWINPSAGCLSCEHSFSPLASKALTSWWSLVETKTQISGGGNFFGTMRKKICPWRLCQTV